MVYSVHLRQRYLVTTPGNFTWFTPLRFVLGILPWELNLSGSSARKLNLVYTSGNITWCTPQATLPGVHLSSVPNYENRAKKNKTELFRSNFWQKKLSKNRAFEPKNRAKLIFLLTASQAQQKSLKNF